MTVNPWSLSHRFSPAGVILADRHYSRQTHGSPQFVPPGRCLVLRRPQALWVTSWPLAEYTGHAWAGAWVCSLFRREALDPMRASDLITAAVAATRWRWTETPALGMVTFIDPEAVRHKRDPGRCFLRAGFRVVGQTAKRKRLALHLLPDDMPPACAPEGAQGDLFTEASA